MPLDEIDPIRGDAGDCGRFAADSTFLEGLWPLSMLLAGLRGKRRGVRFAHEMLWGLLNDVDQFKHKQ